MSKTWKQSKNIGKPVRNRQKYRKFVKNVEKPGKTIAKNVKKPVKNHKKNIEKS